jgi:hypothetical protein
MAKAFAQFAEPSDMAYNLAASIEHVLNKRGFINLSLRDMAKAIDKDLKALDKRYIAIENALSYTSQIALIHGACEDEMRRASELVMEGDKP